MGRRRRGDLVHIECAPKCASGVHCAMREAQMRGAPRVGYAPRMGCGVHACASLLRPRLTAPLKTLLFCTVYLKKILPKCTLQGPERNIEQQNKVLIEWNNEHMKTKTIGANVWVKGIFHMWLQLSDKQNFLTAYAMLLHSYSAQVSKLIFSHLSIARDIQLLSYRCYQLIQPFIQCLAYFHCFCWWFQQTITDHANDADQMNQLRSAYVCTLRG